MPTRNTETGSGGNSSEMFKALMSKISDLGQGIDKGIRRNEDFLRKFNSARPTEEQDAKSRLGIKGNDPKTTLDKLYSGIEDIKKNMVSRAEGGTSTSKVGLSKATGSAKAVAAGAAGGVLVAKLTDGLSSVGKRLDNVYNNQGKNLNATRTRLDELYGKANTKLTGIDKSLNEIKKPLLSRLKGLGGNILETVMKMLLSPPGMMLLAFVGGFIAGKIKVAIDSVKKWWDEFLAAHPVIATIIDFMKKPFVQKILGGLAIAGIVNHLTGGILGKIAGPLLKLTGKGIGKLLVKGVPMIAKLGMGAAKGLMSLMCTPVGAAVAAFAAGAAIGYFGYKMITKKLEEMREKETKEINAKASMFQSGEATKQHNISQLQKLKNGGDKGEQFMDVNLGNGTESAKGHYDESGNFVVTSTADETGRFKEIEPVVIPKSELGKKAKKMNFDWIANTKKGFTRIQFDRMEIGIKRAFAGYIESNYVQTGELPPKSGVNIMVALRCFSTHYSKEGEGLSMDDGKRGLYKQLADMWETFNTIISMAFEPGWNRLRQFVKNYKIVYEKLVSYMVPKSNQAAILSAVAQEKFLFEKNYLESDDWNHIAFAATIYQIWVDIFMRWMNEEYGTDFKSNTITQAEFDEAMANDKGVQSQAIALSTMMATQVRTQNDAKKKQDDALKVAAAKKGLKVQQGSDGTNKLVHEDGAPATVSETLAVDTSKPGGAGSSPAMNSIYGKLEQLAKMMEQNNANSAKAAVNSERAAQTGAAAAITSAKAEKSAVSAARATGEKPQKNNYTTIIR